MQGKQLAVKKILQKIRRNTNDYGFLPMLGKSASYLLKPFYENKTYRIYVINLAKRPLPPPQDSPFSFKLIEAGDEQCIGQIEAMEEWLQERVAQMLAKGVLCLVALDGVTVAGFNLVSLQEGDLPLVHYKKKLRPTEAWSEQITVNKDYRGKKLASILRARMFQLLKNRGIKKFFGGAQVSNIASLNLARKVGFTEIADIQYRKLLSRKRWVMTRFRG